VEEYYSVNLAQVLLPKIIKIKILTKEKGKPNPKKRRSYDE
jgi:hypothetical protein